LSIFLGHAVSLTIDSVTLTGLLNCVFKPFYIISYMPLVGVREPLAEYLYIYSKGITHHYVCSCNLMSNTY